MRIGLVTETFPPDTNGVAMTLERLVGYLTARLHHVDLIVPSAPSPARHDPVSALTLRGMSVPGYPEVRFGPPAVGRLVAHWRQWRPDVLYVATQGPLGWAAVRAGGRLGIPVISGYHTHFAAYGRHYGLSLAAPLVEGYLRRFHQRTALTLAPTRELAATLQEAGFGTVDVLARGVDTALFNPQRRNSGLRSQWGIFPRTPVALYVGRLAAEKNLELAVRSFRAIQRSQPQAHFVLVGDGPMRTSLQATNPDFVFTGNLSSQTLAAHYASADLFLFPSLTDTFGNVVMEAMASGLPVVAFRTGAAAEHIRSFTSGVTAPFGDANRFVALSILIANEPRLRHRLGDLARCAVAPYGWEQVGERLESLLMAHAAPKDNGKPRTAQRLAAAG